MRRTSLVVAMAVALCACSPTINRRAGFGHPTTTGTKPPTPILTWGDRHTWPDGVAVEVAAPKPCVPTQNADPPGIRRAVLVSTTVINGSKEVFDVGSVSMGINVQFAGRKAESVIDFNGPCATDGGIISATVLPGKTFTYDVAYAVTAAAGELQLDLQPGMLADKAIYVGPA